MTASGKQAASGCFKFSGSTIRRLKTAGLTDAQISVLLLRIKEIPATYQWILTCEKGPEADARRTSLARKIKRLAKDLERDRDAKEIRVLNPLELCGTPPQQLVRDAPTLAQYLIEIADAFAETGPHVKRFRRPKEKGYTILSVFYELTKALPATPREKSRAPLNAITADVATDLLGTPVTVDDVGQMRIPRVLALLPTPTCTLKITRKVIS